MTTKIDYAGLERKRRLAWRMLGTVVLDEVAVRCAAMSDEQSADAYAVADELLREDDFEALRERLLMCMANDEDAGEPPLPWRQAVEDARAWLDREMAR